MFGVTTPAVSRASDKLKADGREVMVFHATGVGGRAMEGLIKEGYFAAVLDITTTELADELVGGICSAGPERLRAAAAEAAAGCFGRRSRHGRTLGHPRRCQNGSAGGSSIDIAPPYRSCARVPEESHRIGQIIGERLGTPRAPTALVFPTQGLSRLSVPGGPFFDPDADAELLAGHPGESRSSDRPRSYRDTHQRSQPRRRDGPYASYKHEGLIQ